MAEADTQVQSSGVPGETMERLAASLTQAFSSDRLQSNLSTSVEFAKLVLSQTAAPRSAFLEPSRLAQASVIELGSGTGVLPVLLSQLVRQYIATDQENLLPLVTKNIKKNADRTAGATVNVAELDWTWSGKQLQRMWPAGELSCDLLLAVDCLFNESLVKPFVDTLNRIDAKVVVVVSELRSADVLRLFLQEWLQSGTWQVWRACRWSDSGEEVGQESPLQSIPLLRNNLAVWVGWKMRTT